MYTILLVEDDKDALVSIVKLLERNNYKVKTADNAVAALKFLREEKIDLAIIDLMLPDMNGLELCGIIRHDKRLQDMPIVISTGAGDQYTEQMINKELGISGFLKKPYTVEDLLLTIKNVLDN